MWGSQWCLQDHKRCVFTLGFLPLCLWKHTSLDGPEVTKAAAVSEVHALQPIGLLLCSLPCLPWKVLCSINHEPWPGTWPLWSPPENTAAWPLLGREFGGRGNNFSGFSVGLPQFPELGFLKEQGSLRFSPRCLAALAPQPSPPLPSASQLQSACPFVPCHDSCWSKMNPGLLYCGQILYHLRHQRSAVSLGDGNYVCTSWSGHRGVCIRPRFFSTPMSEAALFDDWSFRDLSNPGT